MERFKQDSIWHQECKIHLLMVVIRFVFLFIALLSSSLGWSQKRIQSRAQAPKKSMTVASYKVSSYSASSSLTQITNGNFQRRANQKEEKLVSAQINLSQGQSLIDQKDGTFEASRTAVAVVSTKINSNWSIVAITSLSEDLRDTESLDDGFSDLILRLVQNQKSLSDWLAGGLTTTIVVPVSERSTRVQELQTSLQAGYNFSLKDQVLAKGFGVSLNLNAGRNFHRFKQDINGTILNEYTFRETLAGSYTYKNVSASANLILYHGINYQGGASQSFEHSQELGYTFSKIWSASIGHTNSGAWFRPNGQDSNLKLINENDSIIYLSTTAVF